MNDLTITDHELLLPGVHILDFWRWALGDFRLNSTRGMLTQSLVAQATTLHEVCE